MNFTDSCHTAYIQPICNGGSVIAIVVNAFNEVKEGVSPVQMLLGKVQCDAVWVKNLLTDQVQHSILTVKVSTTYPRAGRPVSVEHVAEKTNRKGRH